MYQKLESIGYDYAPAPYIKNYTPAPYRKNYTPAQ